MPTSAVRELRQIPFGVLIGQPLKAVVEAQALAAQTTVDFIQSVGFTPAPDDDTAVRDPIFDDNDPDLGSLRTVTFKYSKRADDGTDHEASLSVPFLSILPIPLLRVEETTIEFTAKLTDLHEHTRADNRRLALTTSASGRFGFGFWQMRTSLRGSISSERATTATSRYTREYTMRIFVRAVQDDIPAGLGKVFQILEDTIKERLSSPPPGGSPP